MKKMNLLGAVVIALHLTAPVLASADQPLSAALKSCAQQNDSLARLRCFDKVIENIKSPSQPRSPQVNKTKLPAKIKKAGQEAALFAKAHLEKTAEEQSAEVNEITATITQATQMLRGQWKLSLDNNQKWQQKDSHKLKLLVGDVVVLQKGALGAFYLKKLGSHRRMRVRRIK